MGTKEWNIQRIKVWRRVYQSSYWQHVGLSASAGSGPSIISLVPYSQPSASIFILWVQYNTRFSHCSLGSLFSFQHNHFRTFYASNIGKLSISSVAHFCSLIKLEIVDCTPTPLFLEMHSHSSRVLRVKIFILVATVAFPKVTPKCLKIQVRKYPYPSPCLRSFMTITFKMCSIMRADRFPYSFQISLKKSQEALYSFTVEIPSIGTLSICPSDTASSVNSVPCTFVKMVSSSLGT
ncbi:hypothetical protein HAX54_003007 [Datura stramonium]|uniref:Uncharacterized protein n=1 Tax=Datura stramonium TaxID=4076 RepID=A0ABS8T4S5_DATST|nr:hypothetical protein [Datura stramonium]